jgi:hypothetical protein
MNEYTGPSAAAQSARSVYISALPAAGKDAFTSTSDVFSRVYLKKRV